MRDVIIVGAGIVGCCCAWYLQHSGMKVTLIDKSNFRDGCSFGNSGMIVPSHFTPLASPGMVSKGLRWMFKKGSPFYIRPRLNLELAQWLWQFYRSADKKHVAEAAPFLRDMHVEGRDFYEQLNSTPGFGFNFERKGILMLYQTPQGAHEEVELAEMAYKLGIEANVLSPVALKSLERGTHLDVRGGVHYPGDAHLSPHELMQQLIRYFHQTGTELIPDSEVVKIDDKGKDGASLMLKNGTTMTARHLVIATGSWSGMLMKKSGYRIPMQDGKGYSMTLQQQQGQPSIPAILTEARVAITPMGEFLRVAGTLEISGMDYKVNPHKVKSILAAAQSYYPDLKIDNPGPVWHGYRPCTPDGMPFIGRWKTESSVVLATGHAMMGLSLGPATGRIVKDILIGKPLLNSKISPSRFS